MSYVEFIIKFYDAFKNKDVKTCLELCHDQIEWQTAEGMPNGVNSLEERKYLRTIFQKC